MHSSRGTVRLDSCRVTPQLRGPVLKGQPKCPKFQVVDGKMGFLLSCTKMMLRTVAYSDKLVFILSTFHDYRGNSLPNSSTRLEIHHNRKGLALTFRWSKGLSPYVSWSECWVAMICIQTGHMALPELRPAWHPRPSCMQVWRASPGFKEPWHE